MDKQAIERKLIRTRGKMVLSMPWYAQLSLNLNLHLTDKVERAYTDGILLAVNPEWVEQQSDEDLKLLWAEAATKCALRLPFRMGKHRNPQLWNDAGTYTVSELLKESFTLPPGFPDHRDDLDDKTTEEVYNIYLEERPESDDNGGGEEGQGDGDGDGEGSGGAGGGNVEMKDPTSQESKDGRDDYTDEHDGERPEPGQNPDITPEELSDDWDNQRRGASKNAKGIGNIPGFAERMMEADADPQVDWTSKLREYAEFSARDDFTLRRPNRRYIGDDVYMPGLCSQSMPDIILMTDVSGSVHDREFKHFLAETSGIISSFDNIKVHLFEFDTETKGPPTVFGNEDLPLKVTRGGYGGTDPTKTFADVERYIEDEGLTPCCIIFFSDMEIWNWPKQEPELPVLFVSTQSIRKMKDRDFIPPFGEVCELRVEERRWS
jgi:predicted metal-dependent peptidase